MLSFSGFYCTGSHRVKRKSHKRRRSAFWRERISSTITGSCWRGKKYFCQKWLRGNAHLKNTVQRQVPSWRWGCFEFVWLLTSYAFRQVISCKPGRSGVSNMVQFQIGMLLDVTYRCFLTTKCTGTSLKRTAKDQSKIVGIMEVSFIPQRSRIQQLYMRGFFGA